MKTENVRAIKVLHQDNDKAIIGGYGVVYGAYDLVGDTFTPDTEYGLTRDVKGMPVFYDHAIGEVKTSIGHVVKAMQDDKGIWFEAELQKSKDYANEVLKLVESGALGYSTGALSHLVNRAGNNVKTWIIGELSVTATPAEPRTITKRLKSIEGVKDLEEEENNEQQQPAQQDDTRIAALEAEVKGLSNGLNKILEHLQSEPALRSAGYVQDGHVQGGVKTNAVKSLGDWALSLYRKDIKSLEKYYDDKPAYKASLTTQIMANGGALIPTEYMPQIMMVNPMTTLVRSRAFPINIPGDSVDIPSLDQTSTNAPSNGNSNWFAGATFEWLGENEEIGNTPPEFYKVNLRRKNLKGLIRAPNELMQGTPSDLESMLVKVLSEGAGYSEDWAFLNGNGVGQPLGVYNADCTVSQAIGTDTAPTRSELMTFMTRMAPECLINAIWVCHPLTYPYLEPFIQNIAGSAQAADAQYSTAFPGTILGRPYFITDRARSTVATGGIGLMDFTKYYAMNRTGMELAMSEHRYFDTNETAWRIVIRTDGAPALKKAITISGSTTQSAFIVSS